MQAITHLFLPKLTTPISPSITHLYLDTFNPSQLELIPLTITHLHIHEAYHHVCLPIPHYLFQHGPTVIPHWHLGKDKYDVSEQTTESIGPDCITLVKRTPKELIQPIDGQTYTDLLIPDSITTLVLPRCLYPIKPGCIPNRFTHIDCTNIDYDRLEPGSIPASVTHLLLGRVSSLTIIPATVTDLFIIDYRAEFDIPKTITHLYIHAGDNGVPLPNCTHHLFRRVYAEITSPNVIPAALTVRDRFSTESHIISEQFEQLIVSIELRPKAGSVIVSPTAAGRVSSLVTDLANEIMAIKAHTDVRASTVMVL